MWSKIDEASYNKLEQKIGNTKLINEKLEAFANLVLSQNEPAEMSRDVAAYVQRRLRNDALVSSQQV